MRFFLTISRLIDSLNEHVGQLARWLILACVLVSAGNAVARYGFNLGSNAFLEIQWYLYSFVYLAAAGYTLKHDGHVRIDLLSSHLAPRARAWIDVLGSLLMLLPVCIIVLRYSWNAFLESFRIDEISPNAGGLLRWPIKLVVPVAFLLLLLQGASETIKRIAFLAGGNRGESEQPDIGTSPHEHAE